MKKFLAVIANKFLTISSKGLAKTGCIAWCHREEIPQELL